MKNLSTTIAVAALLLGGSAPVRAAAADKQEFNRYAFADKALDAVAKKIGEVKSCVSRLESMKAEIASKKSEIAAENNGAVPPAYVDMLAIKEARVEKVRAACMASNKEIAGLFEQARLAVRGIEPPSSSGVPKRRERLSSLQNAANSTVKTLH
jgi:hypothetical protein